MKIGQVKLPNPAISPNHTYFAGTEYYWDTYFTVLGLVTAGHLEMARGMVDNLCYLYEKFGLVPARNSWTSLGRTQPPFLTRMAFEIYEAGGANDAWLDKVMATAADEYKNVWCTGSRFDKLSGHSKYRPKYFSNRLTTYESGWDKSTRFIHGAQLLPIDLNCLLFQYEKDLENWCYKKGDKAGVLIWQKRHQDRRKAISNFFWSAKKGFFYDLDIVTNRHSNLMTLAGFFPMWCGLATKKQAAMCQKKLKVFEQPYGLSNTEKLLWKGRQWDYPNGWPPLQLIVIEGLHRYGYNDDANRLTKKWLSLNRKVYERTGALWEKYNVVNGGVGKSGRYPTQPGFAWTNAVFLRLNTHK